MVPVLVIVADCFQAENRKLMNTVSSQVFFLMRHSRFDFLLKFVARFLCDFQA